MSSPARLPVKLFSRSPSIHRAVEKLCEAYDFALSIDLGERPAAAAYVVMTAAHNRDVVLLAGMYCTPLSTCEVVHLPEAELYLAAAVRYARGLTLCGSDHVRRSYPEPNQPEGVLF